MHDDSRNAVESIVNLLYLIELRADNPVEVREFVQMARPPIARLIDDANETF